VKLFTYNSERGARVGAVLNDEHQCIDLNDVESLRSGGESPLLSTMQRLIEGGDEALALARQNLRFAGESGDGVERLDLEAMDYLSPIPEPVKLVCFSVYEKHMVQAVDAVVRAKLGGFGAFINRIFKFIKVSPSFYKRPTYYKGNTTSFIGHGADVQWPSFAEDKMDYELELAFIVGRRDKDIAAEDANDYIWGYAVYNDVSARSRLMEELLKGQVGPLKGKDFHTGNVLGPWIVTADEVSDAQNLDMRVYVNDELRGAANTSEMYYSIPELIATASEGEYIIPGEVIATGAAGDGTGIEAWRFLKENDRVRLEIDSIGCLENSLRRVV
jgi:2-keto-4-pentenoate hydratase/2-oxohepta-3-ene-1,7-dioic acid hydratase in catechol pathway